MAHIQFTSWHEPNSLPIFFETVWPGLTPEAQQSLHSDLYPYLIRHVKTPSAGDIGSSIQAIPSLPTTRGDNGSATQAVPLLPTIQGDNGLAMQGISLLPTAREDNSSSTQAVPSLPATQERLFMRLSTPSSQQISSRLSEESAITSRALFKPPVHSSSPEARRSQQLPAFRQLSNKPLANTQQHTRPQRMNRGVATKATKATEATASTTATTETSLPDISAPCKAKTSTKNLLLHHTTTLNSLAQPSRVFFHSPFNAQDILNILTQSTQSRYHKAFSVTDAEDIRALILESAQAFFENHGHSIDQCKDMIDNRIATESTMRSASIALRFHYLAFSYLRDHLVGKHVSRNAAKSRLIEMMLERETGLKRLTRPEAVQMATDDLSRGQKYLKIIKKFSISTVVELDPRCTSIYEQRTVSVELLDRLKQEGAKTRLELKAQAQEDVSNQHIILEILATCYLSWMCYQYHLSYFPDGCWAQDCQWRMKLANKSKDHASRLHEHATEHSNENDNQTEYVTASRSRDSSSDEIRSEENPPQMFQLAAIALQDFSKALLSLASVLASVKVTSLGSLLSRSRKRPRCSDVPIPTNKQKNASKSRLRTPVISAQSPSTIQPLEMRHDVRGSSFPSQPPTDANSETQLSEADTLYTFLSANSASQPDELSSDSGYAFANHAAPDDSAGRGPWVDDSRFGPPTDFLTLNYMPSSHNELCSDNEFAFANCETTAEINSK